MLTLALAALSIRHYVIIIIIIIINIIIGRLLVPQSERELHVHTQSKAYKSKMSAHVVSMTEKRFQCYLLVYGVSRTTTCRGTSIDSCLAASIVL